MSAQDDPGASGVLDRFMSVALEEPDRLVARAVQTARELLGMDIAYLADLDDRTQVFRAVAGDGADLSVAPGTSLARRESFCDKLLAGSIGNVVPNTAADPVTAELALTRAGAGCYVGVPVQLGDGRVTGTLCCLSRSPDPAVAEREITFMKVLARLVGDELLREELRRRLDRHRQELLAMATHDLRSPATAIVGFVDLVVDSERENLSPEGREHLARAQRATGRLVHLSEQLLFLARADAGMQPTPDKAVDLGAVVGEAASDAGPAADAAGLDLTVEASPDARVIGDPDQLLRLAQNLISNAVKYSEPGETVRVSVRADPESVLLVVADSGCGIPEAEHMRVFERFVRASNQAGERTGAGLGLAICRDVAERHGASIDLTSAAGMGTTVTVTFPPTVEG